MTTVGYGDITPVSSPARTLAWLEEFYIAVLVAFLVGVRVSQGPVRMDNEAG